MRLAWQPITLNLRTTFQIAHGASDQRHNVIVRLSADGISGLGEAPGVPQYAQTPALISAYLDSLAGTPADPQRFSDPTQIDAFLDCLPPGSPAARAALDLALHDLWGQSLGQPLYRLFGLDPNNIPLTSFTIAIADPQRMAERARAANYPILKVKLGTDQDEAIVSAVREATPARLRVDANAGWSREKAAALIPRLVQYDLELVEQPLPAEDIDGLRWLTGQHFGVPIFADESVKTSRDVAALAGAVDGVVIKLMKTGGIREALRAIHTARALGMQVMISCMVESSLGVTAAAHLAPLCDYVDLDGPLLIKNDPFHGVRYHGAQLILPVTFGLGVRWNPATSGDLALT
jgi:L-Ala-D/L-Glu epimerase